MLVISISHHVNKKTRIRSKKDDQEKKKENTHSSKKGTVKKKEERKHALDQESKTAITTKEGNGKRKLEINI